MNSPAQDADIERLARKRAGAKLGWYVHAGIYLAVNLMLAIGFLMSGRPWILAPAFGWGIGLLVHGVVVFLVTGGGGLHDKLVQQERHRLTLQRDPW